MSSSNDLFSKLKSFKKPDKSDNLPQRQLLNYCANVLGSVERLHVDFKEKQNRRVPSLGDRDKKNLAKAISGFANSSGGILIWGIEDEKLLPKPICKVENFLSRLLELSSQVTDPVVTGIDGEWILSDDKPSGKGFALFHVPESQLPPHRVILKQKDIQNHYYIRSGNSFVVAPHFQLEDMFGRRPKPQLEISTSYKATGWSGKVCSLNVILGIENKGRGSAKSPFLSVKPHPPYHNNITGLDDYHLFGLRTIISPSRPERQYGLSSNIVIHPGVTLAVTAVKVKVDTGQAPAVVSDLVIDYQITAEGIIPMKGTKTISGTKLWAVAKK